MVSINRGKRPLSILAVLAEGHVSPGMLSGFRTDYLLICRSVFQALQSAPTFAPDVVIVDQEVADRHELLRSWREQADGAEPVFVALSSESTKDDRLSPRYDYEIARPASGGEIETLLSDIRDQLETLPSLTLSSA
jgi:hypothetical protein